MDLETGAADGKLDGEVADAEKDVWIVGPQVSSTGTGHYDAFSAETTVSARSSSSASRSLNSGEPTGYQQA